METPQLKLPEDPVNPKEPWDDDALGRRSCAETLTKFLENQNAALTISVNGAWGTGKTFFLSRWAQQLKNDGSTVIYFNAWKDDNLDDPLVAIVGQLWRELKGGTFKEFCRACKDAAGPVLKKVVLGVLKRPFEEFGVSVDSIVENNLKTGTESAFDEYSELVDAKENFRERLRKLAAEVFDKTQKPLVFIVDELDRCRPNFAIEVLERIKHLFDIEHVVFVLGIDREQLGHAIRSVYGNIDVENYLHRFIDIDFLLPEINVSTFFLRLWEKHEIPRFLVSKANTYPSSSTDIHEGKALGEFLVEIFKVHRLSLREIEHCLKLYVLMLRVSTPHAETYPQLTAVLIVAKLKKQDLYKRWIEGRTEPNEVADWFFPDRFRFDGSQFYLIFLVVIYTSFIQVAPYSWQDPIVEFAESIQSEKSRDSVLFANILKRLLSDDLKTFSQWIRDHRNVNRRVLLDIVKKIDLIKAERTEHLSQFG